MTDVDVPVLQRLDPRSVPHGRVARLIFALVLIVIVVVLGFIAYGDGWLTAAMRHVLLGLGLFGVLASAIGAFVMPQLEYRFTGYRVDEYGLEIRRGVLWRSIATVARSRVQHLDVTQGPLQRRYDLGSLQVHTAGTHDATITLAGVSHETALALRDDLGAMGEDADGV